MPVVKSYSNLMEGIFKEFLWEGGLSPLFLRSRRCPTLGTAPTPTPTLRCRGRGGRPFPPLPPKKRLLPSTRNKKIEAQVGQHSNLTLLTTLERWLMFPPFLMSVSDCWRYLDISRYVEGFSPLGAAWAGDLNFSIFSRICNPPSELFRRGEKNERAVR